MSERPRRSWAPAIPRHVLAGLSDPEHKVLAAIYSFADGDALLDYFDDPSSPPSFCWPTHETICKATGKARSTVIALSSKLAASGQIRRASRFAAGEWRDGWELTPPPPPVEVVEARRDPSKIPDAPRPKVRTPVQDPGRPPSEPLDAPRPDPQTGPVPGAGRPPSSGSDTEQSTDQISDQISDQIIAAAAPAPRSPFADRPLRAIRPIGAVVDDDASARSVLLEISQMHVVVDASGARVVARQLRAADRFTVDRLARLLAVEGDGLDDAGRAQARREQLAHVLAIFRAFADLCKLDDEHGRKAALHWGPGMFETRPTAKNTWSAWDMVVADVARLQERRAAADKLRADAEAAAAAQARRAAEEGARPPPARPAPRAVAFALPTDLSAALARFAPDAARNCSIVGSNLT